MKNKRILVTGGAGSIGSELVRQLAPTNKIFILDINENDTFSLRQKMKQKGFWVHSRTGDIRNKETLADVFEDFKPQIVFHCAALKHVTPNEEYPREAISTNIDGTMNVIEEAKRWECLEKFVFISTDKVVNAKCIMGITKLAAESIIKISGKQFVAVRFGNVMDSKGSVFQIWQEQIDERLPLTITDPRMERYMMSIPEACELVLQAAENGSDGETWVMDMGEKINISKMADYFVKASRQSIDIKVVGMRPGETLTEKLMTTEEEASAVKRNNFWILK